MSEWKQEFTLHSNEKYFVKSIYSIIIMLICKSWFHGFFEKFVGEARRWDRNSEVITLFLRISLIWRVFLYLQVRNKFRTKAMVDNHYISHNRCHSKLRTSILERKYRWRWIVDSLRISSNFLTLYFKNSY